VVQKFGEDQMS